MIDPMVSAAKNDQTSETTVVSAMNSSSDQVGVR